jgi:nifR3 family TIM-barrel protein
MTKINKNDFSWKKIEKPFFALAPMANITTYPFASICKEMGVDVIFTPMISSNAVIYNPCHAIKLITFPKKCQPIIAQIFGYDGELIGRAANVLNERAVIAGIDINMGCPAPKITGNECGSSLLKDFEKASDMVKTVREMYKGQLSVKLRLGWDDINIEKLALRLEKIGVDAITIHGRTAKQGYRGDANWRPIYDIANKVKIPVIGNGDITDWKSAYDRLKVGNLAGVMIGRGSLGNPWIFKEIQQKRDLVISKKMIVDVLRKQTKRYMEFTGENLAMLEMRKHFGWYIKGFPGALEIRKKAMQVETFDDVENILNLI